jgi:hypothetical protein
VSNDEQFINGVEPSVSVTEDLVFSFVRNNENAQLSHPNRNIVVWPTYDSEKIWKL